MKALNQANENVCSGNQMRSHPMMPALTAETPLVLILEDLHWSDYATLDLLRRYGSAWPCKPFF